MTTWNPDHDEFALPEPDGSRFVGGPRLDPRDEGWDASPEEWAEWERGQWAKERFRREQWAKESERKR